MLRGSRLLVLSLFAFAIFISLASSDLTGQVATEAELADQPGIQPDARGDALPDPVAIQPQPVVFPEHPKPQRVIDKKFIFVMGALGGFESMRFTTRQLVLEHEMSAGAPWVTSVPSHPHLVLKYAPIFAAELLVAYELKKSHDWLPGDRVIRKLWWLYPVAMGAIHLHNAIGNIRTQAPAGGCRSVEECQQQP